MYCTVKSINIGIHILIFKTVGCCALFMMNIAQVSNSILNMFILCVESYAKHEMKLSFE